jgi:hypothetical protein
MSGRTEIERALDGFLAEGPETVNDQALERALDAVDRTKQRRDRLAPWRLALMSMNSRLATAMVVAVLAVGGGAYLLGQRSGVGTSSPAPTASAAALAPIPTTGASASLPAPTIDTTSWIPFTSAFYGFTVSRPGAWSQRPGSGHWSVAAQDDAAVDTFFSPSGWPDFMAFESKLPAGMTADAFIAAHTLDAYSSACYPGHDQLFQVVIDGHASTVAYGGCNEHFYFAEASVAVGNRVWFFVLHGPDRSLLLPFLTTIKLDATKIVD